MQRTQPPPPSISFIFSSRWGCSLIKDYTHTHARTQCAPGPSQCISSALHHPKSMLDEERSSTSSGARVHVERVPLWHCYRRTRTHYVALARSRWTSMKVKSRCTTPCPTRRHGRTARASKVLCAWLCEYVLPARARVTILRQTAHTVTHTHGRTPSHSSTFARTCTSMLAEIPRLCDLYLIRTRLWSGSTRLDRSICNVQCCSTTQRDIQVHSHSCWFFFKTFFFTLSDSLLLRSVRAAGVYYANMSRTRSHASCHVEMCACRAGKFFTHARLRCTFCGPSASARSITFRRLWQNTINTTNI